MQGIAERFAKGPLCFAIAGVCAASVPLLAQEQEAASSPPDPPVVYETATVEARALPSAVVSVTVVDADELAATAVRDAAEALLLVPGARVEAGAARGGLQAARLRGGDPNFTQVLLDGVPLNASTDSRGGSVSLGSLSAFEIDRIEIVRGPVSSVYGSSGLAGAIHLFTRRPEGPFWSAQLAGGTEDYAAAGLSLGSRSRSADAPQTSGEATFGVERDDERVADDLFEK